jgi:transcriptional regulator with XRE-family HTH domain
MSTGERTVKDSTLQVVCDVDSQNIFMAGPVLKLHRRKKKRTVRYVARRARMDKAMVSRYEKSKSVKLKTVERLAKAIGVEPETVLLECQSLLMGAFRRRFKKHPTMCAIADEMDKRVQRLLSR